MENKKTFFSISLTVNDPINKLQQKGIDHKLDIVMSAMNSRSEHFKFIRNDENEFVYFFKTETRKRIGQLIKLLEKNLSDEIYYANAMTKIDYETEIARLRNNQNFRIDIEPNVLGEYKGDDIQFLKNQENWFDWQKDIWNMIFEKNGNFKKPDERKIISLVDSDGNQGKTKFWKLLTVQYMNEIGRLTYGSASQLRSSAINIGAKKLYIIDLARSKGKNDSDTELLSVIEDLKSGLVISPMYGKNNMLLCEPPHIIVSSNYRLKYSALSKDRWLIYNIKNRKLKKVKLQETKIKISK